jgi:DNA-binding SARP family transcriptional activator
MRLNLLGPMQLVNDSGSVIEVGPVKRRVVLAALGLEAGRVVPVGRLAELLWDGDPPASARTVMQGHVSALRRLLGSGLRLVTTEPGYLLAADSGTIDIQHFRELVEAATASDDDQAIRLLSTALALWRGPALADLAGHGLAPSLTASLEESRLDALAALADRLLRTGSGSYGVPALRAAVEAAPLHEPLVTALVLCLYQAGRQADALTTYHSARERLAEQLGVDPNPRLQAAYQTVLHNAPASPARLRRPTGPPAGPSSPAPYPAPLDRGDNLDSELASIPLNEHERSAFDHGQAALGHLLDRLSQDPPMVSRAESRRAGLLPAAPTDPP